MKFRSRSIAVPILQQHTSRRLLFILVAGLLGERILLLQLLLQILNREEHLDRGFRREGPVLVLVQPRKV